MPDHHATFYPVGWNRERIALEEELRKTGTPVHPAVARDRRWKDVLPPRLVKAQCLNERDRAMLRARDAGASYAQISRVIGITSSQVKHQIKKARHAVREDWMTPVECYFNDELGDLKQLAAEPPAGQCRCPTCGRPMKVPVT
jgi:hypothetical protein